LATRTTNALKLSVILIALHFVARPAAASLIITPTFGANITSDANASIIESSINAVIANYESLITTSISINVTFQEMSTGLGQTSASVYQIPYSSYVTALFNHAQSADDLTAIAQLSKSATLDPVDGQSSVYMKGADVKALGINFFAATHAASEGTISLNTSIMNLSRSGNQDSAKYDLQAVVSHELDEVLGLGSSLGSGLIYASPEDLFRYAANGAGGTCSTVKGRSFSTSAAACFSIDGSTGLAQFNNTGSGDSGDWLTPGKASNAQIQDANGTPGTQPALGVELRALDVIGYDLSAAGQAVVSQSQAPATPEPATGLMIFPALGAGWALRRRLRASRK